MPSGTRYAKPAEFVHNISFRLNDEQLIRADAFRSTFDVPSWAEAFRWLFDSEEGRELIQKRMGVTGPEVPQRPSGSSGTPPA